MSRKLIVATGNKNKVKEIKKLLRELPIEVISKTDAGLKDVKTIEDEETLEGNSKKKALDISDKTKFMVLADDSGLFVDALYGQPGVHSSRYSGEEGNDDLNNEKLLKDLSDVELTDRTARFKTVITLILENKEIIQVEGICEGTIDFKLSGENGFGYDPLFIPQGHSKTFGELDDEIKNEISHRGKALKELKNVLKELI